MLARYGLMAHHPELDAPGPLPRPAAHSRRLPLLKPAATALTSLVLAAVTLGIAPPPVLAATTVNLDQWASTALQWQNGNLNGNNSRYPEGGIVPFRIAIEGLSAGTHVIHINYDFTAGGHKAYDFLATWNVTNAAGKICAPSGGGISSMCPSLPAPSTAAFPSDPFVTDGLAVTGAEHYSGAPRRLTAWGATIVSISVPTHSGPSSGNSSADMVVQFRSNGPAVLLAWGGHLGQSDYWNRANGGPLDGASQVSGSPWHMRTLRLDGAGNKNQDRSISPSAIVGTLPPGALLPPTPAPVPTSRPATPAPVPTSRPAAPAPAQPARGQTSGGQPGSPVTRVGASGPPMLTLPPTSMAAVPPPMEPAPGAAVLLLVLGGSLGAWIAVRRTRRPSARRRT